MMAVTTPEVTALRELLAPRRPAGPVRSVDIPELRQRYGGSLEIGLRADRPTLVANFVSTLDGVVSYNTAEAAGGGEISGFFEPDRFVMGLLRSLADAVLIGAGTLRAAPDERWTPGYIHPASRAAYAELRSRLGLRPDPVTVVVTASGSIDLAHPGLADPQVEAVVITTDAGAAAIGRAPVPDHIAIRAAGDRIGPDDVVRELGRRGAELVLCEGGPHLFAQLLEARVVDELFLTLAPQIAGRSPEVPRLDLVEGVAFDVAGAPWADLVDVRSAGNHLFTRYRLNGDA